MLLKWLFTLLALLWLYQALRAIFGGRADRAVPPSAPPPPPEKTTAPAKGKWDEQGDYIDYEEIK